MIMKITAKLLTFIVIVFTWNCSDSPATSDTSGFSECIKVKIDRQCCGFISLEIIEEVDSGFAVRYLNRYEDGDFEKKFEVWNYCDIDSIIESFDSKEMKFNVKVSNDIKYRNNYTINCTNNCEVLL